MSTIELVHDHPKVRVLCLSVGGEGRASLTAWVLWPLTPSAVRAEQQDDRTTPDNNQLRKAGRFHGCWVQMPKWVPPDYNKRGTTLVLKAQELGKENKGKEPRHLVLR